MYIVIAPLAGINAMEEEAGGKYAPAPNGPGFMDSTARMLRIRIGAEWPQLRRRIRCADHREGSCLVFAVERSELGRVVRWETAGRRVLWIVEPEP